ncbi:MAG: orotidine-5'-phosphate decarboxylase [Methanosarcinaceae archaeon]|nr:orotidine-5'-phosphate decarboxylase [Methanosarcinaceae archaeon]
MKKETGIILALDVTDEKLAIEIAEETKDDLDAIKVGYPLILGTGLSFIKELKNYAPVIADFKVADIPNTNRLICEHVFNAGAEAIIIQAFTGKDSLEECVKTAEAFDKKVFVVAEMSHPGGDTFFTKEVSEKIAKMAKDSKAYGIVAPATRPERIKSLREIIGTDMKIISPGVGKQGGSAKGTLEAGADWIIVGRSIYESKDPGKAIKDYVNQIK